MADVIIVGGGITGGTLACALADEGLEVILIDQNDPNTPLVSDGRSFGLSRSSYNILTKLGLWPSEVTPITRIHISENLLPQRIEYYDEKKKDTPLGYVVDSALLKTNVLEKVRSSKNIHLYAPTSVVRLERMDTSILIETCVGKIVKAPLCIAADGRSSEIRTWAQIPVVTWAYNQKTIVCNMAHSLPHHNQAFEHFLPWGPLAFVPRPGQESGLAWSVENEKADVLLSLSEEEFTKEVQSHFGQTLGKLTLTSSRWSYPLSVCLPKKLLDTRLALVGDAAHAFHPVSAQGLNVGLRDAASLAELLGNAFALGLDLGSPSLLRRYQKQRRADILSMTLLTDGLVRVFSNQSRLLARMRSVGFGVTKHVTPLKRFMMRHAMGLTGNVPKLARD